MPSLRPEHLPWVLGFHAVLSLLALRVARRPWPWLAAAAAWAAAVHALAPSLPVAAMQPIREGFSLDHLRMVAGDSLDTGALVDVLWRPLLAGPPSYRASVEVNLCMTGWCALLVGALAWRRGPWAALALAAAATLNPVSLVAALGGLNGPAASLYLLLTACLAARATADDAERPRTAAAAALLAALALPLLREELALVTVAVWVGAVGHAAGLDRRLATPLARIEALASAWVGPAAVAGWVALSWAVYDPESRPLGEWDWLWRAVHPLHVLGLTLPVVLFATLPPGLVLLAGRGAVRVMRAPFAAAGAPALIVVLFATCRLAAHGGFTLHDGAAVARWELYRYLAPLVAVVVALAERGVGGRWRGPLLAMCLLPPTPELAGLLRHAPDDGPRWGRGPGVDGDGADEVRALVDGEDRWPACALLAQGFSWQGRPAPERERWAAVVPGPRGLRFVDRGVPASAPLAEAVAALAPGAPCVRVWRSLDCGQVASAGCPQIPAEVGEPWPLRPMLHPDHGGVWSADEARVGWWTPPDEGAGAAEVGGEPAGER